MTQSLTSLQWSTYLTSKWIIAIYFRSPQFLHEMETPQKWSQDSDFSAAVACSALWGSSEAQTADSEAQILLTP